MTEKARPRASKRRRYPVALRLRMLRLLFGRSCEISLSRELILLSRRYELSARTLWRWVALYRKGGANALRDLLRGDTLTHRAPANVASNTPGVAVRLPLDATKSSTSRVRA
jgi:transposase-like protein